MKVFLTTHPEAVTPADTFRPIAATLVEHPLGWVGLEVVADAQSADSVVTLTPDSVMATMFPDFAKEKLSVCDMNTREVWLNEDRWRRTIPDKSQLPLAAYRAYMVQHELGHALGWGHAEKCAVRGDAAPVMVQQTLGIGQCAPNPFPTQYELTNQKTPTNQPIESEV